MTIKYALFHSRPQIKKSLHTSFLENVCSAALRKLLYSSVLHSNPKYYIRCCNRTANIEATVYIKVQYSTILHYCAAVQQHRSTAVQYGFMSTYDVTLVSAVRICIVEDFREFRATEGSTEVAPLVFVGETSLLSTAVKKAGMSTGVSWKQPHGPW